MISRVLVGINTEIQEHTMRRKQEVGLLHTFQFFFIKRIYCQRWQITSRTSWMPVCCYCNAFPLPVSSELTRLKVLIYKLVESLVLWCYVAIFCLWHFFACSVWQTTQVSVNPTPSCLREHFSWKDLLDSMFGTANVYWQKHRWIGWIAVPCP